MSHFADEEVKAQGRRAQGPSPCECGFEAGSAESLVFSLPTPGGQPGRWGVGWRDGVEMLNYKLPCPGRLPGRSEIKETA